MFQTNCFDGFISSFSDDMRVFWSHLGSRAQDAPFRPRKKMACSSRPPLSIWMGSYIDMPYLGGCCRWSLLFLKSGTPENRQADPAGQGGSVLRVGVKMGGFSGVPAFAV